MAQNFRAGEGGAKTGVTDCAPEAQQPLQVVQGVAV